MNKKLLGVIDATTYYEELEKLINHRSLAALPFGGRYRLIDFILSNMVNSGIESVAIFPKARYRSLMDHLGSGKNWDLNRKRDGLFFFPTPLVDVNGSGIGSFNHFAENMDFFYRSRQEYALIANCYTVSNIDFKKILQVHIESNCDIMEIRKNGIPLQMYLVKTSLLISLIESRHSTGYSRMADVLADINSPYKTCRYEYGERAYIIDSIQSYYNISMNLLKPDAWKSIFQGGRPIYTKVMDEPPTSHLNGSKVKNSMIANGCQIEGTVENSIIFRGVTIEKGAVVKNSIIMQKSIIEENCYLDSVILDKDVKVQKGTVLTGSSKQPHVISKGMVVLQGAVMRA